MKKNYNAPVAEKVDFDYEENVVASGPSQSNVPVCQCPCKQDRPPIVKPSYFWFFPWCW